MPSSVSVHLPYIKPGLSTGRSLDKFPFPCIDKTPSKILLQIYLPYIKPGLPTGHSLDKFCLLYCALLYTVAKWKCQVQCRYTCPTSNQDFPLVAVSTSFPPLASTRLYRQYCCKYTCPTSNQGYPLVAVLTSYCLLYCSILVLTVKHFDT